MSSIPTIAKSLILNASNGNIFIDRAHNVPIPVPNRDEHLIRVQAIALCSNEKNWPKYFSSGNPNKEPVPGYDVTGTVVTAPASSPFQPGADVYCRTKYFRTGAAREYTIALTGELALKPKKIDWLEAAATPISALTAWQALFDHGGFKTSGNEGKRVLVTAASGGVGNWAVQLAKWAGLYVVGSTGPANIAFVKSLGADEVLNYKETELGQWAAHHEKVDLVVDCVGGKTLEDSWHCVKDGGLLVSIVAPPEGNRPGGWTGPYLAEIFSIVEPKGEQLEIMANMLSLGKKPEGWQWKDVRDLFFIMKPNGHQLQEITELLEQGKVKSVVDSVWEFEDYQKAFERADSGHSRGKVILKIV